MFVVYGFRSSWSDAGGCPCCSHVLSVLGLQQRCHHLRHRHVEPSPQADQRAAAHAGHTALHRLPGSRGLRLDSRPGGHAGLALLQLLSADSGLRAATTSRVLRVWNILDQDNGAGEMLAYITPINSNLAPVAVWSKALPLTDSGLPWFGACDKVAGYSGFLHQVQLASHKISHNVAGKVTKNRKSISIHYHKLFQRLCFPFTACVTTIITRNSITRSSSWKSIIIIIISVCINILMQFMNIKCVNTAK